MRRFRKRYGSYFGSNERVEAIKSMLRKNIAMRDQVPVVEVTNKGNIGVYGACGGHVIAVQPDRVEEVSKLLMEFEMRKRKKQEENTPF